MRLSERRKKRGFQRGGLDPNEIPSSFVPSARLWTGVGVEDESKIPTVMSNYMLSARSRIGDEEAPKEPNPKEETVPSAYVPSAQLWTGAGKESTGSTGSTGVRTCTCGNQLSGSDSSYSRQSPSPIQLWNAPWDGSPSSVQRSNVNIGVAI